MALTVVVALAALVASFTPAPARAQALGTPLDPVVIEGRVVDVVPSEQARGVHDFFLTIEADPGGAGAGDTAARYLVDDFFVVFLLESAHGLFFADYRERGSGGALDGEEVGVRLTGVEIEEREVNGEVARVIVEADSLYPDHPASERGYGLAEIDPGCPAPDFRHRYVEVPVAYDHPEWGTFELYYELSSDFDPEKPTVIVPTDGQRTFSQVGWADRYREMFGLSQNVATYEYRGMYCARIPGLLRPDRDWARAYEALKSENVVEDIERIRRDLPGHGPTYVLGGSGIAMIGLKYLAEYHENVDRAFLMSFFRDAEASSVSSVEFFQGFLAERDLEGDMATIRATYPVDTSAAAPRGAPGGPAGDVSLEQLLFLVQRLLYYDQDEAAALIRDVAGGQRDRYDRWTDQLGTVDFFIRSAQRYRPWSVVFMWETNIPTARPGQPDINGPFLAYGRPIAELEEEGEIDGEKFDIRGLEAISTEVLLAAGTLDQVAPVEETAELHRELPNSRLAVFEAYHTIARPPEAKDARARMIQLFFESGLWSPRLEAFFESDDAAEAGLLEVR